LKRRQRLRRGVRQKCHDGIFAQTGIAQQCRFACSERSERKVSTRMGGMNPALELNYFCHKKSRESPIERASQRVPKSADRRALAPAIHNVDLFFSFQSGLTEQEGTRVPFFNHFLSEKWTYNGRASRLGHASADFGRTNP
jgi:hypothetical protein